MRARKLGKPFSLKRESAYLFFGYRAGKGGLLCTRDFERITGIKLKPGDKMMVQLVRTR